MAYRSMSQTSAYPQLTISSPRPHQPPAQPRRSSRSGSLAGVPKYHADDDGKVVVSNKDIQTHAAVNCDGRVDIRINHCSTYLKHNVIPTIQCPRSRRESIQAASQFLDPSITREYGGLPPAQMNIVMHVVGSRGDVQPFISLGKVLHEDYGHRVRLATHLTFKSFVEGNGLEFFSIGGDPAELMAFMVNNPGLMPKMQTLKSGDIGRRRRGMYEIMKGCWRSCIETGDGTTEVDYSLVFKKPCENTKLLSRPFIADAIIANPPSFAHVHCAERLGIPLHLMFTMPWSPTQSFPHPLTTIHHSNTEPNVTNLVSYALVEMMIWQGLGDMVNRFRTKMLNLRPVSLMWAPGMVSRLGIPFTYCWSPSLVPKPEDWGEHISLSGFYFLSQASSYTPDPALRAFLSSGPVPVYIGFGSIVVDEPNVLTAIVFEAISKAGVRAIVSKGWGGLGTDELTIPRNTFLIGDTPHDWLFKHVSAVVHHGGAGTTAAGVLAGVPTVIVPFFGDQPFWGKMIARAGAGPEPIPHKQLTADNLAAAILESLNPETVMNAKRLSEGLAGDQGARTGAQSFHNMLDLDSHRCMVCPDRVAAARIKRTNIRLSPLAAIILADEGLLTASDLKVYRPCEYQTGEEPWDPVSGGTTAIIGSIGSSVIGTVDMLVGGIDKLKTRVGKKSKNKAPASAAVPPTIGTRSDLSTARRQSTASAHTNLTGETAVDGNEARDGAYNEERGSGSIPARSEAVPHNINVCTVAKTTHKHLMNPNDRISYRITEKIDKRATVTAITVLRPPMDFLLALTRGFKNAPKLYGDDTVRPTRNISNFKSGVVTASKELGLGCFDGVTGLVTQPYQETTKRGLRGLPAGAGKGIGGLILKPCAGIFGIAGYTFEGIYSGIQEHMGEMTDNYIVASRVVQGHEDWTTTVPEQRHQVVKKYSIIKAQHGLNKKKVCDSWRKEHTAT